MMIDHFFHIEWRRINKRFQAVTIERHEDSLMRALYNRRERTLTV
jgi:hypothetical protein